MVKEFEGGLSVAPGVGAGFVIYVNCLLYASEAHPAGLEASDFHAEAVAMSLGLTALTALNLSHHTPASGASLTASLSS